MGFSTKSHDLLSPGKTTDGMFVFVSAITLVGWESLPQNVIQVFMCICLLISCLHIGLTLEDVILQSGLLLFRCNLFSIYTSAYMGINSGIKINITVPVHKHIECYFSNACTVI